jgi:hypothetical protein
MRPIILNGLVAAALLCATTATAEVRVAISDGKVTVSAKDATLRQILTEWARVGQTRIVNIERLAGAPVTMELTQVPEAQALDTILRSVSGYLAAPRAVGVPNASTYDRIFLLPTSVGAPARQAPVAVAAQPPAPAFAPPMFQPDDAVSETDVVRPGVVGVRQPPNQPGTVQPNMPVRADGFNGFPQPPISRQPSPVPPINPALASPGASTATPPTAPPVGVSTPGMLVPAPQQQQQPGQPLRPEPQQ